MRLSAGSVARLLDAINARSLAHTVLELAAEFARVDYLAIFDYSETALPAMLEGAARAEDDIMRGCFEAYRRRFCRYDLAVRLADELRCRSGCAAIRALRYRDDEIPHPAWRREVYLRHDLCERLTYLYSPVPGHAVSFNFFRRGSSGAFRPDEIAALNALAPLLRQAHQLAFVPRWSSSTLAERVSVLQRVLAQRWPTLATREREVCARIAAGKTVDAIALELGIKPSSVRTLRKRAYQKLSVDSRLRLVQLLA